MAGGIDWFRWHHGSVTDPKFALVARRAKTSLPNVLAVWAYVLEKASASEHRGEFGDLDDEAIDCLFGLDDGTTASILDHMQARELVDHNSVTAWDKRQPKREREGDETAAERKAAQRAREAAAKAAQVTPAAETSRHVTPCHANESHVTPRGEESREEKKREEKEKSNTPSPDGEGERKPKARASRKCPDDFALSLDMLDWAAQNAPGVNVQAETEKFRDHTFKDSKNDWPGTWRNWLRRAAEGVGKGVGPPGRQNAPDRVSRQLETAALMTGAIRSPVRTNPTQPAEIVDAEFKLIQH